MKDRPFNFDLMDLLQVKTFLDLGEIHYSIRANGRDRIIKTAEYEYFFDESGEYLTCRKLQKST